MKSLHIFQIYVIKEEEIPRDTLGIWKAKGQCNPKVTLEIYICKFSHMRRVQNSSSHAFSWSVNEGKLIILILFSPLSVEMWKCLLLIWIYISHFHFQIVL